MNIENKIKETLEKVNPYLQADGGSAEFVKFEDGIVYVKLKGACHGCPHATMTIEHVIADMLTSEIEEVKEVRNYED